MQAVMAFASRTAQAKAAQAGAKGGGKSPFGGQELGGASQGMSVVGSLMEYAGARQRAGAMDQEARDEEMAGRQEFITAAERVNAIDAQYNQLVGEQLVTASAMGLDAGSGSVVAAREAAQSDADRERRIVRQGAETQAALRRVRSLSLREGAKNARFGATVNLGLQTAQAAMQAKAG